MSGLQGIETDHPAVDCATPACTTVAKASEMLAGVDR